MKRWILFLCLAAPGFAQWSSGFGFDFRQTHNYVTDQANSTDVLTNSYPTTRTVNGTSITFGWETGVSPADRNDGFDARLAGINYCSPGGSGCTFRLDLPSSGSYSISAAFGDASYAETQTAYLYDGATQLAIMVSSGDTAAGSFADAAGNVWTAGEWPGNNVPITRTFSSTTLRVKISSASAYTMIAHLYVKQLATVPPSVTSFNALPLSIVAGNSSTLSWVTNGATTISITPGTYSTSNAAGSLPVYPLSSTTYTLTATNSGGSIQASVGVTVSAGTGPVINGLSCSAHSPSSILCSWTTDLSSTSEVRCGTHAGGPYPYSTGTLNPVKLNSSNYYAVTSHSIALTGLPNNTNPNAYFCVAVSGSVTGNTTTSQEQAAGTKALLTSTPVAISWVSPPTRVNDQYNGAGGMPNNGMWIEGDTQYNTWADDGFTYGHYQDGLGVKGAQTSGLGFLRWDASHLTPTQLQSLTPGYGLGGSPWSENGALSARGNQYVFLENGYGNQACCFNVIKSADHWATSIAPEHNTGPGSPPVPGLDVPSQQTATIISSSWNNGTVTLTVSAWSTPPPVTAMLYVEGSAQCDGYHPASGADATHVQFASSNVSCTAGTVRYMSSMMPGVALPGDAAVYNLLTPIQPCQDYSMNCTWVANMDGWVYLFAHYRGLVRVRLEDLPLQDVSKYQCYKGNQDNDDGLYDNAWTGMTTGPCRALTVSSGPDPYAYLATSYNKAHIGYLPDFNRFILSIYVGANNCAVGSPIYDLGPYPWGRPVLIGSIDRDLRYPGLCPGFPNPLLATYQKISSDPLNSTMTWVTSGGSFKGPRSPSTGGNGANDNYTTFLWNLKLVPRTGSARRPQVSSNGGGGTHIGNGLQLFYNFQDTLGTVQLINHSPNDPAGGWAYAAGDSNPLPFDGYGLIFGTPSGSPDNVTDGISWGGQQQNYTLTTPYSQTLNSFTGIVCFGHYPYQFDGITINDGQAGEQVLSKINGDLSIVRHGSTFGANASWDVKVHGTPVGTVSIPDGSFGCLAVRVSGTNATLYDSHSMGARMPLTPSSGPTAVPSSGSAGALQLGGPASLWGILSELLIYNRALTDVELIHEMELVRRDMATRRIALASESVN